MEISFAQCDTILKTLPIGYYAGRRVGASLDDKAETSFYSPMEDVIVVSYPIIAHRMKQVTNSADIEEAVRSMLYHEVSHAMLTNPRFLPDGPMYNIFEDERIETVLKDYYMNTNFKQQLMDIHGGKIPEATDPMSAFYNAVRFRCAPQDILNEVEQIIRRYSTLNRTDDYIWWQYCQDIRELFGRVTKNFKTSPSSFQMRSGQGQQGQQQNIDTIKRESKNDGEDNGNQGFNSEESNQHGDNKENGESQNIPETDSPLSEDEIRRMVGACMSVNSSLSPNQVKQLEDFTKTVEMIIGNFNKKNSGGSGINAYSGVFNPRAVARQDYRFFERSMSSQGNNKFGTCHLNLFIDCSGSMSDNEEIVNGILASLTAIERKNRNFTMDVSFINDSYKDCETVRDRWFEAHGSNTIPADMKERFLKRQLPNTCNYNIVLFDGDAICCERLSMSESIQRFSAFDYKQTTLITDPDNAQYLGSGFKNAKVVVTNKYTKELISHITKALMVAFG